MFINRLRREEARNSKYLVRWCCLAPPPKHTYTAFGLEHRRLDQCFLSIQLPFHSGPPKLFLKRKWLLNIKIRYNGIKRYNIQFVTFKNPPKSVGGHLPLTPSLKGHVSKNSPSSPTTRHDRSMECHKTGWVLGGEHGIMQCVLFHNYTKGGTVILKPCMSKDQTLPIGSRESFTWIIPKTSLCLVFDF